MKRRALSTGFCVVVALIACGVSPFAPSEHAITPPASPARSLSPLATVTVQSKPTLCATVGGSFANGTPVKLVNCSGASTQQWAASSAGEYRANGTVYCLDLTGGNSADGTPVQLYTCNNTPAQQWTLTAAGELKGLSKCLEPQGQRLKTNTALVINACANRASQKWAAPAAPVEPPPTCQDTTATNYGGALPCAYPPPPSDTNTYVTVLPGQSIQAAVDANPAGTKFKLKAGTYSRQTVTPKAGDLFRGESGAVLDGENVTAFAFKGSTGSAWVNDVTLVGLTVTRYAPPAQNGAIWGGDDLANGTSGWVLDSLEVSYSAQLGVRIGNRMQVLRSNLHHNGTVNIGGIGRAVVVDGSEFAYGNAGCPNDPGFESGGSKFVRTDSLIVRNSFFHHNCGVGLWLDIANIRYTLENNRIEDNVREGIAVEISFGGVIRNNTVLRNGTATDPWRTQNWLWDAGIGIHASSSVEVSGNTVADNFNGIVGIQQTRGGSNDPPNANYVLQDLNVHDNTVKQNIPQGAGLANAAAGIVQDNGDAAVFTTRNNRFQNNRYTLLPLGGGQSPGFEWQGWKNDTQWQAVGNDLTGTFTRQ